MPSAVQHWGLPLTLEPARLITAVCVVHHHLQGCICWLQLSCSPQKLLHIILVEHVPVQRLHVMHGVQVACWITASCCTTCNVLRESMNGCTASLYGGRMKCLSSSIDLQRNCGCTSAQLIFLGGGQGVRVVV
jgi:hypothetical protein